MTERSPRRDFLQALRSQARQDKAKVLDGGASRTDRQGFIMIMPTMIVMMIGGSQDASGSLTSLPQVTQHAIRSPQCVGESCQSRFIAFRGLCAPLHTSTNTSTNNSATGHPGQAALLMASGGRISTQLSYRLLPCMSSSP
jgi:hypothetical protein